ncbi:MAG: LysR family transcriptional regulator [Alicyclobacillus herbarius]|uniref:LysR family transcriptional regulator n=1 Tax=Alicyclobacillus herbarius TaxID=122960 RepID=UPI002356F6CA|nr:LysR family transcriptional regulator [Alicyclobacillus herbarius]MCL6631783.1 LysR family transcriptional regulator [Alicyclobacillus herbarius]
MELRHLQYFVAVAEERHFGRAAERLRITQPPLSQQIRQLEEEVGAPLFVRGRRGVELTPAGEVMLVEARKALAAARHALEAAQRAGRGEIGQLAVGFVGSATYDILPAILREYSARHPQVAISLYELSTPSQEQALLRGGIDVGLVRPPLAEAGLAVEVVQESDCVLAVPRGHVLAQASQIELDDLRGVAMVALARTTWEGLYDTVIRLCREAGFSPVIRQEAKEFQTVIGLVAGGLGVAFVPQSARNLHTRDVVYRELSGPAPKAAMGVAWRDGETARVVQSFVEVARSVGRRQPVVDRSPDNPVY